MNKRRKYVSLCRALLMSEHMSEELSTGMLYPK